MFAVVKPFAFSLDGFTSVSLVEGDRREDFGTHTAGLLAEGYILAAAAGSVVPVVEPEPAIEPDADETAGEQDDEAPRRGRRRK